MNLRSVKKFGIAIALLAVSTVVMAAQSPTTMLQSAADKMIAKLSQNKNQLRSNPNVIHRIVNSSLIPYIDVNRMAGSVVGRNYWQQATPAQRRAFVSEFKSLVINTYSNALASFDGDTVKFFPIRGGVNRRYLRVNSVIVRKSGQRIPISYNVLKTSRGWKIYDFSIEGVSIVQNYRAQFANTLTQGGIPQLLKKLKARG